MNVEEKESFLYGRMTFQIFIFILISHTKKRNETKPKAVLTRHRVEIESTSFHFHIGRVFLEAPEEKSIRRQDKHF